MILQCPSCQARFMVADALIPAEGRTVKCGRCAHQWEVRKPEEAATPTDFADMLAQVSVPEPEPVPEITPQQAKQLPVPKPYNVPVLPFKIAVGVLAAAWMVVALYAYFPSWQYGMLSGIYSSLGVTDTRGVVFDDVLMEKEALEGKTRFILSGSIANHDAVERTVPRVRVELKNGENDVIWSRLYPVDVAVKPGELYPFRIEDVETSFADQVVSIVLDVGNNFELVMR